MPQSSQSVLVLGSESDVRYCRSMGMPVIGSIGGVRNASQTLQARLCTFIEGNFSSNEKIMAWGYGAMMHTNRCSEKFEVFALVDEVDFLNPSFGHQTCVPTSPCCADVLHRIGFMKHQITEPVIAVEPCALVVEKGAVLEALGIQADEFVIAIVGNAGAWQEIISLAVRLHFAKVPACIVVPTEYIHRSSLMQASREHNITQLFAQLPSNLRQIDLLHAAHCAWCPSNAHSNRTCGVVDVLEASSVDIPLAVPSHHPIATLPSIGKSIAWSTSDVEVAGWMIEMREDNSLAKAKSVKRVSSLRAIATPSRFVENVMSRISLRV
jgi:hypothetical protein